MRVRLACEAELARCVLGRQAEDVRGCLGQTVALDDLDPALAARCAEGSPAWAHPRPRRGAGSRGRRSRTRLLGHEEIGRGHAHHRRHPLLLDQAKGTCRLERRLEYDGRPLPPREERLHVPAAGVELRKHLQDDVAVRDTAGAVEREVGPEAVRVGENGSLGLAGRPGRVRQEERIVVRDVDWRNGPIRVEFGERNARDISSCLSRELRVGRLDDEQGRSGVVELVSDLVGREPPVERLQGESKSRAGEERRHVVGRVRCQRRNSVAACHTAVEQCPRDTRRACGELLVRQLPAGEVDRDPVRRVASPVLEPAPDGVLATHPRNSPTTPTKRSGCSQKSRCPQP